MSLLDHLDFELAWKKTKSNLNDTSRIFLNDPYILDIIDNHSGEYIGYLKDSDDEGYHPSESRIVNVPKAGWNVRPGSVLTVDDATVYSALVLALYDDIRDTLEWSAEEKRFSRILLDDVNDDGWIKFPPRTWNHWNEKSKDLMEEYDYVLFTDITSYFENVEHRVLTSNLRDLSDKDEVIEALRRCLRRWSHPRERGIPQGYYPSDILSEVYLNRVDERLALNDIEHTRFSDNLRIFSDSKREAIESLETLTEFYRDRGLNLQSSKTEIVDSDDGRQQLQDPNTVIDDLSVKLVLDVEEPETGGGPYDGGTGGNSEDNARADGGERAYDDVEDVEWDSAHLEAAFRKHIIESESFEQHLFRFLIVRLGILDSHFAIGHCIDRIEKGLTETRSILDKYFSRLSQKGEIGNELASAIDNDEIMYEFQTFAIIRWFWENDVETEEVLSTIREQLREGFEHPETENYAIAYLGAHGNETDLETISNRYQSARNTNQQAVILMAIREMERGMRNSVYRRAEGDDILCRFSTEYASDSAD